MALTGLTGIACEGTLSIGGVSMNRRAWAVAGDENGEGSLMQLWATASVRGDDRLVAGAPGRVAYPRRLDRSEFILRLIVVGCVDENGDANADAVVGLDNNLTYIYDNVIASPGGDGTRAATLTKASGAVAADIHVLDLTMRTRVVDSQYATYIGSLRISIPAGRFA